MRSAAQAPPWALSPPTTESLRPCSAPQTTIGRPMAAADLTVEPLAPRPSRMRSSAEAAMP